MWHTCALDARGVKCWGGGPLGEIVVPKILNSPIQVATGQSQTCAVDAEGVQCWKNRDDGYDNFFRILVAPIYLGFKLLFLLFEKLGVDQF
jgi:hypothetical protein